MNTRPLMAASAILTGLAGLVFNFAPDEITTFAGAVPSKISNLTLQLLGALYLGFAMLNWMAKSNLIGGVYSRPVAMGNFLHFAIGALAILKALAGNPGSIFFWIAAVVYTVFGIAFGMVFFGKGLPKS